MDHRENAAVAFKYLRTHPSTISAFAAWGAAGFMAQPTFASFLVHFIIIPALIAITIWLAHHEGRKVSGDD